MRSYVRMFPISFNNVNALFCRPVIFQGRDDLVRREGFFHHHNESKLILRYKRVENDG